MNLKTALVHEWLTTIGGSEKVLEAIYELYPAPLYTLIADRNSVEGSVFERAECSSFKEDELC